MKKTLIGLLVLMMVSGFVALAQAANPETVTVRVTITSLLDITLVSGGLINFGTMDPNAAAVVVSSSTVITNNSSGVNQTYKMYANSPGVWAAGSSAVHDTYVLKAAFHGSAPANAAAFDTHGNILGEDVGGEITASGTVLTIDGTSTGLSVAYDAERSIWYSFQPPATSSLTGEQDIIVTITAIQG